MIVDVTIRPRFAWWLTVAWLSTSACGREVVPAAPPAAVQAGPQRVVASVTGAVTEVAVTLGASSAEAVSVGALYDARAGALAWAAADGAPPGAAEAMLARLHDAARHALAPAAYLTPAVVSALDGSAGDATRRDVALTLAVLRYMGHLHLGRIDPRSLGRRFQVRPEPHDFPQLLARALADGRVVEVIDALAPPFAVYGQLVDALARYRALAALALPAVPSAVEAVRAGDRYPGVPALARRLVAFGDLDSAAAWSAGSTLYDAALSTAVVRFQTRHGLTPDGVVGRRTLAALQVPLSARVAQIEFALERLRWLPDLGDRRLVLVNIPMFRLWAWEAGQLVAPPVVSMEVIVGRAMRSETPVFVEQMEEVVFWPYWNVPRSIVLGEVLPAVDRDPGYLARQQMEIVRGWGDDAPAVAPDAAALTDLAAGRLRLRQRPGPHNSLGLVKFMFPNNDSIYMHDTPAPLLFARERRDFSHGCIRVQDPTALAAWVLAGRAGWTKPVIEAAMARSTSRSVPVAAPIDVVLFYSTAAVSPDDGALHFANDIYGHDATLARALTRAR